MKPRVLVACEYSKLSTGYGVNSREILNKLHESGKYELAEFAAYAGFHTPQKTGISLDTPWKLYLNEPTPGSQEHEQYKSDIRNVYGKWRFDRVCLDFEPTHVITLRDFWMDSHVYQSLYRPYYSLLGTAPVDSSPQRPDWFEEYISADGIFSLTEWGAEVLKEEGGGLIKVLGHTPHCVAQEFRQLNKDEIREKWGLDKNAFIIGTVMRNQKRKLFAELMESFRETLNKLPKDKAEKTYLLLYTCYPDMGWNIPQLINEFGLGHKVLVIYHCKKCGFAFPHYWHDASTICYNCGSNAANLPGVTNGLDNTRLAEVYNLMDLYVQYANAEGFGVPIVEAAACGVPVIGVNHSAMAEVISNVHGYLINPITQVRECELTAYRAAPNNQELIELLTKLIQTPANYLAKKSQEALDGIKKYYNSWSIPAKKWMNAIDNIPLKSSQGNWNAKPNFKQIPNNIPDIKSNDEFIKWCILNILQDPDLLFSKKHMDWVSSLNLGVEIKTDPSEFGSIKTVYISKETLANYFINKVKAHNKAEQFRIQRHQLDKPDFIQFANR